MTGKTITNDAIDCKKIDKELNAIFCLSEVNDSILMWSHYANSHQGICIEYSPLKDNTGIALQLEDRLNQIDDPVLNKYLALTKVNYHTNMPPTYNRLKDNNSKFIDFLKTKHSDWHYEKEWRVIFVNELLKKNPVVIKRQNITGIIFGLLIDDKIKRNYINICKKSFLDKGFSFKFYQCYEKQKEYALDIQEIELYDSHIT